MNLLRLAFPLLLCVRLMGAQQVVNTGTGPNTGTGDTLKGAFEKVNANFTELYGLTVDYVAGVLRVGSLVATNGIESASTTTETMYVGTISLTNQLDVANGGTGKTSLGSGKVLFGNGTGPVKEVSLGSGLAYDSQTDTLSGTGGGGGSTVSINGVQVATPNFNGSTPSPPSGGAGVAWTRDVSSVLGYVPLVSSGSPGTVPATTASKWLSADGSGVATWADLPTAYDNGVPRPYMTTKAKGKWWGRWAIGNSSTTINPVGMAVSVHGSATALTMTANNPRGIAYSTTTAVDSEGGPYNASAHVWGGRDYTFQAVISLSAPFSSSRVWVGWTANSGSVMGSTTPDDTIGFRYDPGAGDAGWVAYSRDNTTTYANASGVSVIDGTVVYLLIEKTGSGVTFWINGSQVGSTSVVPASTGLVPYINTRTLNTTAKVLNFFDAYAEQPWP
jgi:hypothetical protein